MHVVCDRTEDIPMQICEPYDLHKTKQNESAYEEFQTSPADAVYEVMPK